MIIQRSNFICFQKKNFWCQIVARRILLCCLKFLGKCPCPRCTSLKTQISEIGTKADSQRRIKLLRVDNYQRQFDVEAARKKIFQRGKKVTSKSVEAILGPTSQVPTRVCHLFISHCVFFNFKLQNAFSKRFAEHGLNFYQMFVPDLLHEFELGVFKATFTHLIRILHAYGNYTISSLNAR